MAARCFSLSLILMMLLTGASTHTPSVGDNETWCSEDEWKYIDVCFHFFENMFTNETNHVCDFVNVTENHCMWMTDVVVCIKLSKVGDGCLSHIEKELNLVLGGSCNLSSLYAACPELPCVGSLGQDCANGEVRAAMYMLLTWINWVVDVLHALYYHISGN